MDTPIELVCCYASEDEADLERFLTHLRILENAKKIRIWHAGMIQPGEVSEEVFEAHLEKAYIILLLTSAAFLKDHRKEIEHALKLHEQGMARVVPIILRHYYRGLDPLDRLKPLPDNGQPINRTDEHAAWAQITKEVLQIIEEPLFLKEVENNKALQKYIIQDDILNNILETFEVIKQELLLSQSNEPPTEMLEHLQKIRSRIREALQTVRRIVDENEYSEIQLCKLDEALDRLDRKRWQLLIAGDPSSDTNAFVDALLNRKVLTSLNLPPSRDRVHLRYGQDEPFDMIFSHNRRATIEIASDFLHRMKTEITVAPISRPLSASAHGHLGNYFDDHLFADAVLFVATSIYFMLDSNLRAIKWAIDSLGITIEDVFIVLTDNDKEDILEKIEYIRKLLNVHCNIENVSIFHVSNDMRLEEAYLHSGFPEVYSALELSHYRSQVHLLLSALYDRVLDFVQDFQSSILVCIYRNRNEADLLQRQKGL